MRSHDLRTARTARGWSQAEAAARLGVSQPYLAMLESGKRPLTAQLARKAMHLFRLPPTVLPPSDSPLERAQVDAHALANDLAVLGYPGFAYLRPRGWRRRNPGEVLLSALAQQDLEARLVEALPWLLLRYWDLDQRWLVQQARLHNLQNRLGFVVSLARRVAERSQDESRVQALRRLEVELEQSRLAHENTLGKALLTERERQWLMENRPEEARRWNVLTDWSADTLRYGPDAAVTVG